MVDKDLPAKLREEAPGILNWAIEGCLRWQAHGLPTPKFIADAIECYQSEMDVLDSFLKDCCVATPDTKVSVQDLYQVYTRWCEQSGERAVTKRQLSAQLKERGYENKKSTGGVHWWVNITVRKGVLKQGAFL